MNERLGTALCAADRKHVLDAYCHRMTHESVRRWPGTRDGGFRMSLIGDAEWLASTLFRVRESGRIDMRVRRCEHDFHKFRTVVGGPKGADPGA